MEAVRQIIDSDLLNGIVSLPKAFQNRKVEVIVFPANEKIAPPQFTEDELDGMLKGSITESLIGAVPNLEKSLKQYRAERLSKHECVD